jgi:hypothetical protein
MLALRRSYGDRAGDHRLSDARSQDIRHSILYSAGLANMMEDVPAERRGMVSLIG